LSFDYRPPSAHPIIDGVTLPFGDESQRSNTDNHEFHVRIPQLDHRGDVHPGEQRQISPPPARCVSLLNFLLCETHGLAKSIESADNLHQERATTALQNWKERFDPSISHPNARILLPPSDTVVRQEMPLKPEIFHGRDDFVEDIARSLLQEETSRICILGPGGMGKTSVSLAVVELPVIKERFPGGNCVWVPCIEATSATLLLEILYIQLQVPGDGDTGYA
jgi:hypothetical protein